MYKKFLLPLFLFICLFLTSCDMTGGAGGLGDKTPGYFDLEEASAILKEVGDSIDFKELIIENDIVLPTSLDERVEILWESSNEEILSRDGKVNRPLFKDEIVTLIAEFLIEYEAPDPFEEGKYETHPLFGKKQWDFTVKAKPEPGLKRTKAEAEEILNGIEFGGEQEVYEDMEFDKIEEQMGIDYVDFKFKSLNPDVISDSGKIFPTNEVQKAIIEIEVIIYYRDDVTQKIEFLSKKGQAIAYVMPIEDFYRTQEEAEMIANEIGENLFGGATAFVAEENLPLFTYSEEYEHVELEWFSSNELVIRTDGTVYHWDEDIVIYLDVEIKVYYNSEDYESYHKSFEVTVPSKAIVVTFWHAFGLANQTIIQEIIDTFEEKYPGVKVEQYGQGGYDDLKDKVKNSIKAGCPPTVVQTYPDHVASYLTAKNVMVDLNKYAYDPELGFDAQNFDEEQFIDAFYKEGFMYGNENHLYSLPFNKSTEVLIYDKDIFNKYDWFVTLLGYEPSIVYSSYNANNVNGRVYKDDFVWQPTWQEIEKISAAFLNTEEYKIALSKYNKAAGFSYDSIANLYITLTQQFAAQDENDIYGKKGEEAYVRFSKDGEGEFTYLNSDNPYASKALKYYKEQQNLGHFTSSYNLDVDYCSDSFKEGKVIMFVGSSAGVKYAYTSGKTIGVATYPQLEGTPEDEYQVIQQGTNISLLQQQDKVVEKYGWLFMLHMTNYENVLKWAKETSYLPSRKDVVNSKEYQDYINKSVDYNQETLKACALQSNWYFTNAAFVGTAESRECVDLGMRNLLLNNYDIEDAVAIFFEEARKYLQNYMSE